MRSFPVSGGRSVSLALFSDVSNSRELLDLMQSGKLEPEAAFLNASLVPDVFPVLAAAHKALLSRSRDSLTTRTLHSELVYNYSGSKHITESLKRCGISDDTAYVLAARFDASVEEIVVTNWKHATCGAIWFCKTTTFYQIEILMMKAVEKLISGTKIDLADLGARADQPKILKQYKITPQELSISTLPDAIICRISARDAL